MLIRICLGIAVLVLSLPFTGSSIAENEDEAQVNEHRRIPTRSIRYGIHSQELRETMLRLNTLVSYSREPGLPLDDDGMEFLNELITTVDQVVIAAEKLKHMDPSGDLGTEQVSTFTRLAEQLHTEAISIDVNARSMEIEQMNRSFLKLNQTCIACHGLFRGL